MKHQFQRTTRPDPRDFWLALARVIEHYAPDEAKHYQASSRAARQTHIDRDLRTLKRLLLHWIREASGT